MNTKKRGLGRGLSALIGGVPIDLEPKTQQATGVGNHKGNDARNELSRESASDVKGLKMIGVDQLQPGRYQPRQSFDENALQELAMSLKEKGVLQPLLVRAIDDAGVPYEIVAGERRWRAAQMAGLHELPIIIRRLSDTEALEIGIIENVQRADLNPIEEAEAYQRLMQEFSYTQDALAKTLGKSRSHIANTLRLSGAREKVRALLIDGKLSAGHARTLLGYEDADGLAQKIIKEGLSVRAVEKIVARGATAKTKIPKRTSAASVEKDADTRSLEKSLEERLGLSVSIDHAGAAGAVTISYKSLNQLDEVVRRLMANTPSA